MRSPFTPLIAAVHRGIPFTASDGPGRSSILPVRSRAHLFRPALGCTGDEMRRAPAPSPPMALEPRRPSAGSGIELKLSRLHESAQIIQPRDRPGDASFKKSPQDASPKFDPPPQLIEKEELKTSCLKTSHPPTRCVTRMGSRTPRRGPVTICKHAAFNTTPNRPTTRAIP